MDESVSSQVVVFGTLAGCLVLFITSFIRYDLVAMSALLFLTFWGIIPSEKSFSGFANPAVITVVAVLILSKALENAGLVSLIGSWVAKVGQRPMLQVAVLTSLVAFLSAFINNVGALALLMPVAIQLARKSKRSPSYLLMPMAFGSLLGGMTTLIGTPPNLIISDFRRQTGGTSFSMFDFSPVGLGIALLGIVFISLFGWRLVPKRQSGADKNNLFNIEDYLSEVIVPDDSEWVDQQLIQLMDKQDELLVLALLRGKSKFSAPSPYLTLKGGDILILRADSESLSQFVEQHKLVLSGDKELPQDTLNFDEVSVIEAVVTRFSPAEKRTARDLNLRTRFSSNLLAIARRGQTFQRRLSDEKLRVGDVLLLQMPHEARADILNSLGLLPLAERDLKLAKPRRLIFTLVIFIAALCLSAFGIFPSAVTFSGAALLLVLSPVISLREAYAAIDWSIVVLLGAMIPVGEALETTGGAQRIAEFLLASTSALSPTIILGLVLLMAMFLSDVINNAAAAIVMAPIGISLANGLGVSADAFLLAIAIGASCAFLTPIGHQSNTLVMGPGGYRFGDYWRMGLVLELLILLAAIPLLRFFWPFDV
ncbi:MAG: SLC13 family permease [Trueperaceae bacterium]|nr:SLC13 family permease [Trueperaceae bacterium]